jgi:hypothetical protein
MKDGTYPIPTGGKKPPAPDTTRPAAKPNPRPSEAFTGTRTDWEEAIFRHAEYFTAVRRLPRRFKGAPVEFDRREFKSFPAACKDAGDDPQVMVYAVSEGHSFCIPRNEWERYALIWEEQCAK